jgi:hypothetical protein
MNGTKQHTIREAAPMLDIGSMPLKATLIQPVLVRIFLVMGRLVMLLILIIVLIGTGTVRTAT